MCMETKEKELKTLKNRLRALMEALKTKLQAQNWMAKILKL